MWKKLGFTIANCIIIVFLTACGNSTVEKSAVEMNSLELEEGRKGAETNTNSNEVENEAVSEIEQKNVDDFTSKINNSDKLEEWLDSLKLTEYKYCIWNEESLEGKVLENDQLYELKDNDEIILYKPEEFKRLSLTDDVECNGWDKHEKYNIMNLFLSGNVSFESEIEAKDGTIYPFRFELISALKKPEDFENPKSKEEMTGKEWAKTLTAENPEFIVWNDENGTKRELQNGEEYQFQEGDIIAIFYSDISKNMLQGIKPYKCELDYYNEFTIITCDQKQSKTEYEAQLVNEAGETITISFILLQ